MVIFKVHIMSIGFNKSFLLWLRPTIHFLSFFLNYENIYYLYIVLAAGISNQHRNSDADKWKSDCISLIIIRFYMKTSGLSFISIGIPMLVWNSGCKNNKIYKIGGPAANSGAGDAKYIYISLLVECQL